MKGIQDENYIPDSHEYCGWAWGLLAGAPHAPLPFPGIPIYLPMFHLLVSYESSKVEAVLD